MGQGILLKQESEPLAITAIGERFQGLRIVDPSAERTILNSMRQYGQLTPVVVCRLESGSDELLDGFKRLRAARSLAMGELTVSRLEIGPRGCKAAILQLNRVGRNISSMEEALVVHSLCHDDGLSQVEIAGLLGRHKSWVSRRVALIARLSDEAQERIRLGLLPSAGRRAGLSSTRHLPLLLPITASARLFVDGDGRKRKEKWNGPFSMSRAISSAAGSSGISMIFGHRPAGG